MTTFRVDADQVAALGAGLADLAVALAGQGEDARADSWALGGGEATAAFEVAVGHWRHERLALARALDSLGPRPRPLERSMWTPKWASVAH